MTAPEPRTAPTDEWTVDRALARVLDLVSIAEAREPAYRYVSTKALREAIQEGL